MLLSQAPSTICNKANDDEVSDTDDLSAVLSSRYFESAWSSFNRKPKQEENPDIAGTRASQAKESSLPPVPAQPQAQTAGLTDSAPFHRPRSTDSRRVKDLLRAKGLRLCTHGLENYYPFSRGFRPGGEILVLEELAPNGGHSMGYQGDSCHEGRYPLRRDRAP